MRLVSTRDAAGQERSYTDVLLEGLAPDGGLYVPKEYPRVSREEIAALRDVPYAAVAYAIKKKLIGEAIPDMELRAMIDAAYAAPAFALEEGQVTPVKQIGENLYLQNLSLGPTASFKDMAMQMLGREMEHELARTGAMLTILGATSGDTGSAAEAALKGLAKITLCMLSPEVGMSDFQRAQMGALSGGNIHNVSIKGRFDDCQDLVKAVKHTPEFAHLGAVNSINWGRISSQVPYYFAGYLAVAKELGEEVDFVVPSGNFGNVFSGYVAKQMGLPIRRLIVATNENDVLHRLIQTGLYEMREASVTSSPSMDISKASNYERLAFDILGRDPAKLAEYMDTFTREGNVSLADFGLGPDVFASFGFVSGTSTHADRLATIKRVYDERGTVIDPHTADGMSVARSMGAQEVPTVCLATAHPVKFEATIEAALGFIPERSARFRDLEAAMRPDSFTTLPVDAEALQAYLRTRVVG